MMRHNHGPRSSKRKPKLQQSKAILIIATAFVLVFVSSFAYVSVVFLASVPQPHLLETRRISWYQSPTAAAQVSIQNNNNNREQYGTLHCDGLSETEAQEVVYWKNIPSDRRAQSDRQPRQFLTFGVDEGGFNNIRMSMEVILTLALNMNRTIVLPPVQEMYLLYDDKDARHNQQQCNFGFEDFFPVGDIAENTGLEIISMETFLTEYGLAGHLFDGNGVSFPPHNRTNWDGDTESVLNELLPWLESVAFVSDWNPLKCLATFGSEGIETQFQGVLNSGGFPSFERFVGNPVPVDADPLTRLPEVLHDRKQLCRYNKTLQTQKLLHFPAKGDQRLLVHFYSFLFFESWKQDLYTKRFIRDQVRYKDEIQCIAARIIKRIREMAGGDYDSFHVRRGEFQYKMTRVDSIEMYQISKDHIPENATVYMATDERKRRFFNDLAAHYRIVYLDDFADLLEGVNTNLYGLIDQIVASRSRTFFGCWFSSFSAYVNRIRGYHAAKDRLPGFQKGIVNSYFYAMADKKFRMRTYWPLSGAMFAREFPIGWRDIDHELESLSSTTK